MISKFGWAMVYPFHGTYIYLEFRINVHYPPRARACLANRCLFTQGVSRFLLAAWPLFLIATSLHEKSLSDDQVAVGSRVALFFFLFSLFLSYFRTFFLSCASTKNFTQLAHQPATFYERFFLIFQFYFCRHGIFNNRFRGSKAA